MPITKIQKKRDGLQGYRVRVNYTDPDTGAYRRIERIVYGKAEAADMERQLNAEIKAPAPTADDRITVAEVFRALDGPIAAVRGLAPEDMSYPGAAEHLRDIWVATRSALRAVLEEVTLAEVVSGDLPEGIHALLATPGAWERR